MLESLSALGLLLWRLCLQSDLVQSLIPLSIQDLRWKIFFGFFVGCWILISKSYRLLSDGGPPLLLCIVPVCLSTVIVSEFCSSFIIILDFLTLPLDMPADNNSSTICFA